MTGAHLTGVRNERKPLLARAYTLTEMLVVLVIIGLLAAIVGPRLFNRLDNAKRRTAELQMKSLETSIDLYRLDMGRIPTAQEGLDGLVRAPDGAISWLGPYLARNAIPLDPWGHAYAYAPDPSGAHFRILSFGADGREGGEGAAQDIALEGGGAPLATATATATPAQPVAPSAPASP